MEWIRPTEIGDEHELKVRASVLLSDNRRRDQLIALAEECYQANFSRLCEKLLVLLGKKDSAARSKKLSQYYVASASLAISSGNDAMADWYLRRTCLDNSTQMRICRARLNVIKWNLLGALSDIAHCLSAPSKLNNFEKVQLCLLRATCESFLGRVSSESEKSLKDILETQRLDGNYRIRGQVYLARAHSALIAKEFSEARCLLSLAERELASGSGFHVGYLPAIAAMVMLRSDAGSKTAQSFACETLVRLRTAKEWELARYLEFDLALARRDENAIAMLYLGTPYPGFRSIMDRELEGTGIRDECTVILCQGNNPKIMELTLDSFTHQGMGLKKSLYLYNVFMALTSDLFKPVSTLSLFHSMFPGELFLPESSPRRVYFALSEFRKHLKQMQLPLNIKRRAAGFVLVSVEPISLRICRDLSGLNREQFLLKRLFHSFHTHNFQAAEVRNELGLPARTALRVLQYGVKTGVLERRGKGSKTAYLFTLGYPL